jgi:hypothetical protein
MTHRVLIDSFTLRRDVASNSVLGRMLEGYNCDVRLACVRDFKLYLRYWRPDVIVVSAPDRLRLISKKRNNQLVLFYPGEGNTPEKYMYEKNYFQNEGRLEYKKIDRHYLWGEYSRYYADKYLPESSNKRKVIENIRLDLTTYNANFRSHEGSAKTIGILGRFSYINSFSGRPAIAALGNLTNDRVLDGVISQVRQFRKIAELIKKVISTTNHKINIRPHPLENPLGYDLLRSRFLSEGIEIDASLDLPS